MTSAKKFDHQMDYNGQILKWGSRGSFKASQCGCKSTIFQYSTQLEMDGYNSQLLTAKLTFSAKQLICRSSQLVRNGSQVE